MIERRRLHMCTTFNMDCAVAQSFVSEYVRLTGRSLEERTTLNISHIVSTATLNSQRFTQHIFNQTVRV